jgi:hypothetical protein
VSLDPECREPGYLLGRLFAVYEQIQTAALGRNVNATIKDKFYALARLCSLRHREVRLANRLSNNCTLVVTITGACQFSIASRSLASDRSVRNASSFLAVSCSIDE